MIKNSIGISTYLNNILKSTKFIKTAQDLIPISDIEENIVYKKNNEYLEILKIEPININLISEENRKNIILEFSKQLNSLTDEIQIFCIGRPVDLNEHLNLLRDKIYTEKNFTKKTILKRYFNYAAEISVRGEITEKNFYVILKNKNLNELAIKTNEIIEKFSLINIKSYICNEKEILDLYCLFAYPMQAYYENNEKKYLDLTKIVYYDI